MSGWQLADYRPKRVRVNIDTTVATIYGDIQGAHKGHNTKHRGTVIVTRFIIRFMKVELQASLTSLITWIDGGQRKYPSWKPIAQLPVVQLVKRGAKFRYNIKTTPDTLFTS